MSRRTEPAVEALTASIGLNPSFAFAHAMLGMAHTYTGLPDLGAQHIGDPEAQSEGSAARALSVGAGPLPFHRRAVLQAVRLQREAVSMRPHFVSAWRTLASASALSADS
jgi:hypothetical protein